MSEEHEPYGEAPPDPPAETAEKTAPPLALIDESPPWETPEATAAPAQEPEAMEAYRLPPLPTEQRWDFAPPDPYPSGLLDGHTPTAADVEQLDGHTALPPAPDEDSPTALPPPVLRRARMTAPVAVAPSDVAERAETGWGGALGDERKAQLDAFWSAATFEQSGGAGPLSGVRLSGADVYYLAALSLAGPDGDLAAAAYRLRQTRQDAALRFVLDLSALHLEGANLEGADLAGAALRGAHLRGARMRTASLHRAVLRGADLEGADLEHANLRVANLEATSLRSARLQHADLAGAVLARANLRGAHLEHAILILARLEGAHLRGTHLESANLAEAQLDGAFLGEANLQGANLYKAQLDGVNLTRARLEGANLRLATFGRSSLLRETSLNRAALAHVALGNADLTGVYWEDVRQLGDEIEAGRTRTIELIYADDEWRVDKAGKRKHSKQRRDEYRDAGHAYLSLAVALRAQGMPRQATRFHYRGELMERYALLYDVLARLFSPRFLTAPWAYARWLLSWMLGTFVGYGDKISRLVLTYVILVVGFAAIFVVAAQEPVTAQNALDALAYSLTSFHGHGLQGPDMFLDRTMVWFSGAESFIGLVVEALFVAAFTRRLTAH